MKELIKPVKNEIHFKSMKVKAFHEESGQYSEGGHYQALGPGPFYQGYYEKYNLILEEDFLF